MTIHAEERNLPALAAIRIARLERCKRIKPYRANDEELVCANDGFEIYRADDGTWRHSSAEIATMRALASEGSWPK
jgi:hypothetical protein